MIGLIKKGSKKVDRTLFRIGRLISYPIRSSGLILVFHRVNNIENDPQLLCIKPHIFEEQLNYIAKNFHVTSLGGVITTIKSGKSIPKKTVIITFDDGYYDNFSFAKPILEKYNLPATFFVTAGFINSRIEFWWDELEKIFLNPGTLPDSLNIEIVGMKYDWSLSGAEFYNDNDYKKYQSWTVSSTEEPTRRHLLYRDLCNIFRVLPLNQRLIALDKIRNWANVNGSCRSSHRGMTGEELKGLSLYSGAEIGAHTMSHCSFSNLPISEQFSEITVGKSVLEDILDKPVKGFSYPYGTRNDFTRETVGIMKEAGFTYACANFQGAIEKETNIFEIPRNVMRSWGVKELREKLDKWFKA